MQTIQARHQTGNTAEFALNVMPGERIERVQVYEADDVMLHRPDAIDFYKSHGSTFMNIDQTWSIELDRRNPLVGQLDLGVDRELLAAEYVGGQFFIVDNTVIDYRSVNYKGYTHSVDNIKELTDAIGFVLRNGKIQAGNITHNFEHEAFTSAGNGGQFDIQIGFNWSPFSMDIESMLKMVRLACENGMIASSPIMNNRIPMINEWKENLMISNDVIGHAFHKMVSPRLAAMPDERVSLYDIGMMMTAIVDLANSKKLHVAKVEALETMYDRLDVLLTPEVRAIKKNMLKFIEAPVSAYDAMNLMTECATHYVGIDKTATKASALANNFLFDQKRQRNIGTKLDSLVADQQTFLNADQAFFGITSH